MKYSPSLNRGVIMSFKFDGKKVKADMSSALGYAQKSGTKFMNTAGAAASTAKQMGAKATGQAAAGGAINAFGKGMKLAKAYAKAAPNPLVGGSLAAGIIIGGTLNNMRSRVIQRRKAKK